MLVACSFLCNAYTNFCLYKNWLRGLLHLNERSHNTLFKLASSLRKEKNTRMLHRIVLMPEWMCLLLT